MDSFGHILKRHRVAAGLSLRQLGALANYQFSHISQVERGKRRPTRQMTEACERVLAAGGALTEAYEREQAGDTDMRRRTVLQAMGALAAVPAVAPLVGWEGLRHGLGAAMDVDEWEHIAADYGLAYYRLPADVLEAQLRHDFELLGLQLSTADGARRVGLLRAAGRLSVVVALGLVASGQAVLARRFWRSARQAADQSGDPDTRVLVRAWDVTNGSYDGRPAGQVVALSDQVLPLIDGAAPSAATCGLLAGRAQALSLAGRHAEAVAAVRQLGERVEALPEPVVADVESLWGWPEHRLRHTESWVHTYAGDQRAATAAQERALALYPESQRRLRTQVQLHQAAGLIRSGHIPDGLRLAADLLDGLPREQHNELVRAVARQVTAAVPEGERRRPAYGELVERVRV